MFTNKFKVGDLVMYANKGDDSASIRNYFMKPAQVIRISSDTRFPYIIKLLNEDVDNSFTEEELVHIAQTKDALDTLLIRATITEATYEQLLKTLNNSESVVESEV